MVQKITICLLLSGLVFAKIPIVLSPNSVDFIYKHKKLNDFFHPIVLDGENSIIPMLKQDKYKFAIVRSDILIDFHKKNSLDQKIAYSVIGKLPTRSILYFASDANVSNLNTLTHKRFSIGKLGYMSSVYFKEVLQRKGLLYSVNMISKDAFRSLDALRAKQIDGMFLFSTEKFNKIAKMSLKPYPEGLRGSLGEKGLICPENEYCYASYYLIALDRVGGNVMQNIYQLASHYFDRGISLEERVGKHYVHIKLDRPKMEVSPSSIDNTTVTASKNAKMSHFGRAPWMDFAVAEAIQGKGSPEYAFPMLDLSYKYIRFSKGSGGITTAPNDNVEGSWCAAYVCWTLDRSGYKVHKSGRMASQSFRYFGGKLYRKIKQPIFGAITVFTNMRKPAHGHVGYLFGYTKTGRMIILGGNQGNRLKFSSYSRRFGSYKLNGFYVPMGYKITDKDRLTDKDIYRSVQEINRKYGIINGGKKNSVR